MGASKPATRARAAPRAILTATAAIGLAFGWLTTVAATSTPTLGIRFAPPVDGETRVVVASVEPSGPADGILAPGDTIVAIASPGGARVAVSRDTLVEDPDFLATYERRRAFFAEHEALSRALEAPEVVLHLQGGTERHVRPQPRTVAMLPFVFWFQLFCGLIALLTGATVFALRREQIAARLYGFTGLTFATITYTAATYSARELTLPAPLFRALAALDHLGSMTFIVGYAGLIWHYPTRLSRFRVPSVLAVVLLGTWLGDTWGVLPSPDWGIRTPMIAGLSACVLLGLLQWRRTRRDPIGRAGLRWLLLSMLLGGTAFVITVFVTVWLRRDPFLSQGYAFGFVLPMYLGVALGVTRYRLFQLERWWLSLWLWVVAGASIVVVDLTLVHLLHLEKATAAGGSVLLVGALYFPARQWLIARLVRRREADFLRIVPRIVKLGLRESTEEALARDWRALLKDVFDVLEVSDAPGELRAADVADDGLALLVPGVAGQPPTRLALAHGGSRLFTPAERDTVQALVDLIQHTLHQRQAYDLGAKNERERVARDLHDDIGSRLLTLVHRAGDGPVADLARDTLRELRTVVSTLGAGPAQLTALVADWRDEAAERCEAAQTTMVWEQRGSLDDVWIEPTTHTNVLRVLREILSNALRHGRPSRVEITASVAHGVLSFDVVDDGASLPPSSWLRGRGLANIRQRLDALGGEHAIRAGSPQGTHVTFRVPLAPGGTTS